MKCHVFVLFPLWNVSFLVSLLFKFSLEKAFCLFSFSLDEVAFLWCFQGGVCHFSCHGFVEFPPRKQHVIQLFITLNVIFIIFSLWNVSFLCHGCSSSPQRMHRVRSTFHRMKCHVLFCFHYGMCRFVFHCCSSSPSRKHKFHSIFH